MTSVKDWRLRVYVPFGEPIYSFFYIVKLNGQTYPDELLSCVCDHMQLPKIYRLAYTCSREENMAGFLPELTIEQQITKKVQESELRVEAGDYPRIYLIQN